MAAYLRAIAVVAALLLAALAVLFFWPRPRAGGTPVVQAPAARGPGPTAGGRARAASRAPRLLAPGAAGSDPLPMPEGLAQDLDMFNDDQIRAELESILLSHPAVTLVRSSCPQLPCRAEVASPDRQALQRFVAAVAARFQNYMTTQFRPQGDATHPAAMTAFMTIGTSRPAPPDAP